MYCSVFWSVLTDVEYLLSIISKVIPNSSSKNITKNKAANTLHLSGLSLFACVCVHICVIFVSILTHSQIRILALLLTAVQHTPVILVRGEFLQAVNGCCAGQVAGRYPYGQDH